MTILPVPLEVLFSVVPEAMLIYMEASYEKNGTVDGTADGYWRALRTRAKLRSGL